MFLLSSATQLPSPAPVQPHHLDSGHKRKGERPYRQGGERVQRRKRGRGKTRCVAASPPQPTYVVPHPLALQTSAGCRFLPHQPPPTSYPTPTLFKQARGIRLCPPAAIHPPSNPHTLQLSAGFSFLPTTGPMHPPHSSNERRVFVFTHQHPLMQYHTPTLFNRAWGLHLASVCSIQYLISNKQVSAATRASLSHCDMCD
jgi:hypothetical protein